MATEGVTQQTRPSFAQTKIMLIDCCTVAIGIIAGLAIGNQLSAPAFGWSVIGLGGISLCVTLHCLSHVIKFDVTNGAYYMSLLYYIGLVAFCALGIPGVINLQESGWGVVSMVAISHLASMYGFIQDDLIYERANAR